MTATLLRMPSETALRCECGGAAFYLRPEGLAGCVRCGKAYEHGPPGYWRLHVDENLTLITLLGVLATHGYVVSNRRGLGLVLHKQENKA